MSHKMLRPFIVKVSVLGYFPLRINKLNDVFKKSSRSNHSFDTALNVIDIKLTTRKYRISRYIVCAELELRTSFKFNSSKIIFNF